MRRGLFHRSTPYAVVLVVGVALSCGEITEDEMVCEEAVARLERCCSEIDPRRINCVFAQGCDADLAPVLTSRASGCLGDASCADMRSRGICSGIRQLSLVPYQFQSREAIEAEACR
ncbi:MAG: hypothetical protein KIS78_29195 [Labilithrix sp.]|nr:hypothetical protein [Labilithrix sp.]MCW5836511.1 hypothetical protein [Labilithrix sp.]